MEENIYNQFNSFSTLLVDEVLQITIKNNNNNSLIFNCVQDLRCLLNTLRHDNNIRVVVFNSDDPSFFQFENYIGSRSKNWSVPVLDPLKEWFGFLKDLAVLPQATVAVVKEKFKGEENGFLLACDMTIHF